MQKTDTQLPQHILKAYKLVQTCDACPEQYDVFRDGRKIGYLRLRHGFFSVTVPTVHGEVIYATKECKGDGAFEPDERDLFLNHAIGCIHAAYHDPKYAPLFDELKKEPEPTEPQNIQFAFVESDLGKVAAASMVSKVRRFIEQSISDDLAIRSLSDISLVSSLNLPPIPTGIETKTILAKDGTPLLEMVKIPAGPFLMGSDASDPMAYHDEYPQRLVELPEYWAGRTLVTNRMWAKFLQESGYIPPREHHDGDYLKHWKDGLYPADKPDYPVTWVSWYCAVAFCDFYRLVLPTESQWEKAARGTDGRLYPWGNQPPTADLCNFGRLVGDISPVGQYPAGMSPNGLLDCAGNVWEWCKDKCSTRTHSLRGGGFYVDVSCVRCAFRNILTAPFCNCGVGFRVFSPGH